MGVSGDVRRVSGECQASVRRGVMRQNSKHSSKMRFSLIFGSLGVWESGYLVGTPMDTYWTPIGHLLDTYWTPIFVAIYEEIADFINFLVSGELGGSTGGVEVRSVK